MDDRHNSSGLLCLRMLFAQFRRDVNFAALVTKNVQEAYLESPGDTLFRLSE